MDALMKIRAKINDFPGYGEETDVGRADAEVRAYAGERLAALQERLSAENAEAADSLEPLILHCAFANQRILAPLERPDEDLTSDDLLQADLAVLELADAAASVSLATLEDYRTKLTAALDARDAALTRAGINFR
jgi:hypothetical protein